MAKAPSLQFYPGDIQRDTALNSVSLAAYGLWHRMMWAMFDGVPFGHLSVNGSVIPPVNLSLLLRVPIEQLEPLLLELETARVFSRNEAGVIYSRRMVRDAHRREVNAANGSKGGNPRLSKSVKRTDNREVIPLTADAVSNTLPTQGRKERAKSIPERIAAFTAEVRTENAKRTDPLPETEVVKFIAYWTQAGTGDRKFHAEKQQTFGIAGRLITWGGRINTGRAQIRPEHTAERRNLKTTFD